MGSRARTGLFVLHALGVLAVGFGLILLFASTVQSTQPTGAPGLVTPGALTSALGFAALLTTETLYRVNYE